jgi:hypothetical protein
MSRSFFSGMPAPFLRTTILAFDPGDRWLVVVVAVLARQLSNSA